MEVIETITIEEIRKARPSMIYYGAQTCWWTHDPKHLRTSANSGGLPCDPRGGVLFETDDVEGFLASAEQNAAHCGQHGLRAFIAAHHLNAIVCLDDPRPTAERGWQAYNDALDRLDARKARKDAR